MVKPLFVQFYFYPTTTALIMFFVVKKKIDQNSRLSMSTFAVINSRSLIPRVIIFSVIIGNRFFLRISASVNSSFGF